MINLKEEMRLEDFSYPLRQYIEAVGIDAFIKLSQSVGGKTIYIPPREGIEKYVIKRKIREEHENGASVRLLAAKYQLNEKTVYDYINQK